MKKNDRNIENKMSALEKLYLKLDIPPDIINDMFIEIRGRTNMCIRGCREIRLYTPKQISVQLSECVLQVFGKELYCTAFNSGNIEINGIISSIVLDSGGQFS